MEINPKKLFKDKFPTASVKLLVGSEAVQQELTEILDGVTASEQTRALNEELRLRNEEIRDAFEMGRQREEEDRKEYEDDRREKESERQGEEQKRVLAEQQRVKNDSDRGDAEYSRYLAEIDRVNEERVRDEAYKARVANDTRWEGRENKREARETDRIQKEGVRESNETTRINNESTRIINESGRVMKEKERVSAENARQVGYENWKAQVSEYSTRISNNAQEIQDVKEDLTTAPEMNGINQYTKTVNLFDRTSGDKVYPITTPDAVLDKDGHNIIQIIEKYWAAGSTESEVMYGVELDVTVADPAMTRIGNMDLHRQLPLQNRMKGCLLDDNGEVVKYLNPTTWEGEVRDGSRGQVMVELPEHYRKFETDGKIRRVKLSEYPLPGYHYVPKMYISAYEATVQRSTNKLCSVVNASTDYRGGGNQADWDGTFRSMLGHPATAIKHSVFRSYARNRNASETSEWNMLVYDAYQTMVWLYFVEYANLNCQLAVKGKDVNGYSQGGLGNGFTNTNQANAFSYYPILPCGVTDSLGNGSGEVAVQVMNESGAVAETKYACRYRGVENPFGHMETYVDGVLGVGVDGDVAWYFSDDTSKYSSSNADGYQNYGRMPPAQACVKNIIFGDRGDILCTETGASTSTYFCDYVDITAVTDGAVRPMLLGGGPTHGGNAGFLFTTCKYSDISGNGFGTRLCFIPKNK